MNNQNRDNPPRLADIWREYLKGGYFDGEGHLREEYVSRQKVAPLIEAMAKAYPALTSNQLRRFFSHARAIEAELRAKTATWEEKRADFLKLDFAVSDAFGKKDASGKPAPKVPQLFYDFMRLNVATVRSETDFLKGFMPHFEALVGFGTMHLTKERG
jgi:CRISPR type III-A-associated protein Csm2